MPDPRTSDEYLDLVDEAIFEFEEMLVCAQDDEGGDFELAELRPVYEAIVSELKALHAAVRAGHQAPGSGQDLPFMALVNRWQARIPPARLLVTINRLHKNGLPAESRSE